MQWYNEPAQWSGSANALTVTPGSDTDYWRVTLHGYIKDDAPFYYETITGDFTATVGVRGAYTGLYDQAGLMVRASAHVWLKCGIEYMEGQQYASAVITRDFSDWSIVPLAGSPAQTWFRVKRLGAAVEVWYALDNQHYTLIRQGYLTDAASVQVGMMCAAPRGEGFSVTFEGYKVERAT